VTSESESNVSFIEAGAFVDCSSLSSVCVRSSVGTLGEDFFWKCRSLLTSHPSPVSYVESVTFEPGLKLGEVEGRAFAGCVSLQTICLPHSLQIITRESLTRGSFSRIDIDKRHPSVLSGETPLYSGFDGRLHCARRGEG
jgi:hypothetical protein